jgi:predicted ATPase/Tfp pilus assembly protein PilF/tRNA A-37 threonylcarbamoyl transferase component Bud32
MPESQLDLLSSADLPLRLGRYELQSILGEGGMARVFGAELLGPAGFRKLVAVKVIKSEAIKQANSVEVEGFIREARLGGLLKHPNIVDVYELGDTEGQLFIAMELVEGQTLYQLIGSGEKPPAAVVLEIASGVAAGLASAHSLSSEGLPAGLVHRDMKPSNVLVSWEGAVKVSDFGIAITRYGELAAPLEARREVVGTYSYMSPEQLQGEPLDGRSDLFSLGLVLTELATATRLPRRLLLKRLAAGEDLRGPVLSEEFLAPVEAAVPGLRRILLRCLEPIPEARYPTAAALLSDLELLRRQVGSYPRLRTWLSPGDRPSRPDAVAGRTAPTAPDLTGETATDAEAKTVLARGPRARTNLGTPLDSFVGRETELAELAERFAAGARLVTIKGTGGAGKTRFACRFARSRWDELAGGAWFVDLTEARTPVGLLHATAMALELPLRAEGLDALAVQVGHAISGRGPVLLVLDNFEQVVQHASVTLGRWLQMAPEASFLVTSREPLKLEGEQVFALAPLPEADGVTLFESRARAAGATLPEDPQTRAAVARIVAALDGLPLAIELAAARAVLLSPDQLLERLSERFKLLRGGRRGDTDRQSTLRGLIDWSWDLLEPWEQAALAQLSVFRDGFFMDAAEAVLDLSAWPDAPWSLDVVGSLLDKSLLYSWEVHGQPRFGMYVSIQEYAAQELGEATAAMALRHAQHFASFGTEAFFESLHTHGGVERRKTLAFELENLIAGVDAGLAADDWEVAAVCALVSAGLFETHGPFSDGVALLERVCGQPLGRRTQGRVLGTTGWLLCLAGRSAEALAHYEEALAVAREVGDRLSEGVTLGNLGSFYRDHGRIPEALAHYEQALAVACDVGNRRHEGIHLAGLASIHYEQGHITEALEHYQQALAVAREVGNCRIEGVALGDLATLHCSQGRIPEALAHYQQALAVAREMGDRRNEGVHVGNLGDLLFSKGDLLSAEAHLRDGIAIGDETWPVVAGAFRGSLALIRAQQGAFGEARALLAQAEPQLRGVHKLELGKLLCKKAQVEHLAGDSDVAASALAEAEIITAELNVTPDSELGRALATARSALG